MSSVDPGRVRNVVIAGHGGTGKTTLIEHVLHMTGKTSRAGKVEEGNTVCDYLDEEKQRKQTLALKLVHVEWNGARIHMVDTPGYVDFIGELAAVAPVIDAIIIMVDATTGIQVGTDNAFHYAKKYDIPHAFFVNKLDREHTNYDAIVDAIRETFGRECVPMIVPSGAGASLDHVVSVLDQCEGDDAKLIEAVKVAVSDVVAESHDDLIEGYLETGQLSQEDFCHGLQEGIEQETIVPILAGSVEKDIGVRRLLNLIAETFPSPLDRHVKALDVKGNTVELKIGPDEPFVGQVFRSVVDPFVGQLTLFRVLTGTLKADSDFVNVTNGSKERTGKIFLLTGKDQETVSSVGPGDIAALTKLKHTHFGDTIAAPGVAVKLPPIEIPQSMVKLAIVPKSRADEDKIGEALNRLREEDPTFSHYRDEETGEHVVRGMGDIQLEIMLARMKNKFNVEAATNSPKVAYKETISRTAEAQGKHKKQSGGHGQYGDVHIRLSPNVRGGGYEFIDSIVGGVVPRQYIPAADKGAQEALARGIIAGYPAVDIKVELFFGSYHDVDSSEMAFKLAASLAIQKAFKEAAPKLLEPVMQIEVVVPDEFMGDVNGDLNSRRGRIVGMDSAGPGRQRVIAHVPEAEVLRYSADLRSMTHGRGSYHLAFDHYEEVPEHVAQQIVSRYEKERASA